jgi:hypothetical protein
LHSFDQPGSQHAHIPFPHKKKEKEKIELYMWDLMGMSRLQTTSWLDAQKPLYQYCMVWTNAPSSFLMSISKDPQQATHNTSLVLKLIEENWIL